MTALFWNTRLQSALLFLVALLLYAPTLTHGFVLDDGIVLTENNLVKAGWSGLGQIFRKDSFFGFTGSADAAHVVSGARYRPLSLALFALLYQVFGAQPFVFHFVTVLLYAGVVWGLYRTLLCVLRPRLAEASAPVSFVAALLFAVHPVHTEVGANIKSCDELLALGGGLLTLYMAWKAVETQKWPTGAVAALCFLLACLSKESALPFLALFPLMIGFLHPDGLRRRGFAGIFLLLCGAAVLYLILRSNATGGLFSGKAPAELLNNPYLKQEGGQWVPFTTAERTATAFYALGKYLQLLVFPHPLTHDYYPRHIDRLHWGHPLVVLSAVLYMFLAAFAVWGPRRLWLARFGAAWYLLTLSIVSNLLFSVGTHLNERFLFTPSVGFCLLVAGVGWAWTQGQNAAMSAPPPTSGSKKGAAVETALPAQTRFFPLPFMLLWGTLILLFATKTLLRNPVWASDERLVLNDVQTSANSARANDAAAGVLFNRSLRETAPAKKQELWQKAVQHAEKALRLYPDMASAHATAAKCHHFLQHYDTAIVHYRAAIRLAPERPEYRRNLAMSLRDGGQYYGEQRNDLLTARRYLAESWGIAPTDPMTAWLTGVTCWVQGDYNKAAGWYAKAAALAPGNATYLYDWGAALRQSGNETKGVDLQRQALQINPRLIQERQ